MHKIIIKGCVKNKMDTNKSQCSDVNFDGKI